MSDTHGRFIWYELTSSDAQASKAFYRQVLGWTASEMPSPEGADPYTVVEVEGLGVGGIMPLTDALRADGVPDGWTGYVAVDDVDATCAQLQTIGGGIKRPAHDIPGIGRFAIVFDPAGAVFAIMAPAPMEQERQFADPAATGNCGWRELTGGDPTASIGFYGELFGWRKDDVFSMGPMGDYLLFANQDGQVGGMMKRPDGAPGPGWTYYWRVEDIDAGATRVTTAGGRVLNGPMEVPSGDWVLQAVDPQGALFALMGPRQG